MSTPRNVALLEDRIRAIVDELVGELTSKQRVDLIADFAYMLPATVIAGMLGVPEADVPRFRSWSDDLAAFVGGAQAMPDKYERAARGIAEMDAYFRDIVRSRRGDGPAATLTRTVREPIEISGTTLPSGDRVFLSLAAANRDPARFREPDRFDIRRADNRHIAFGHGPHFCIGAPLARMETRIAFEQLLARTTALELDGELDWADNLVLRGLRRLPLRIDS